MTDRRLLWLCLPLLVGCQTNETTLPSMPAVAERIQVVVYGDGFVRTNGRKMPLDSLVLELRQRVRTMGRVERGGLRIEINVDLDGGLSARDACERLVDQLQIMGIMNVAFS